MRGRNDGKTVRWTRDGFQGGEQIVSIRACITERMTNGSLSYSEKKERHCLEVGRLRGFRPRVLENALGKTAGLLS